MKKIKLHLTRHELRLLIGFVEFALHREQFAQERTGASKLVMASLAELLIRLNKVWDYFKIEFKFTISIPNGLALLEYCVQPSCHIAKIDAVTINKVIGIVHQKTI